MYWLISLPGDKQHGSKSPEAIRAGREATFRKASMITQGFGSPCFKFDFDTLKVGTLDALMLLSDELDKYDKHADMTLRRIMRAWTNEVVDDNETNLASALKVDIGGVEVSAEEALCSFRWMENRFPHKQDLSTLAGEIHRQICEQDDEVKDALNKYSQIRNAINAMNRKSGGNLVVKDLHGIVDQSHYVEVMPGEFSEKIVPVFIVVPKQRVEDFVNSYETKSKEVVPRSWRTISEDDSYVLGRVLHLECPSLQSFKQNVTESKCTVRDFTYDSQAVADNKADMSRLEEQAQEAKRFAKENLRVNFGEVFLCHLHLKAVRIFVESVLWYGLPVNFQSMAVKVNNRKEGALMKKLDQDFADAKGDSAKATDGEDDERTYINFPFDLEFLVDTN